jgi:hypothetical protein
MARLLALGVVLLLLGSGAGAVVAGASATAPAPGASADASPSSSTAPPLERASASDDATANRTDGRQFEFSIRTVSTCGLTCRDVTVSATNTGNATATNVTVETRLEAGETVVWRGNESVERLEPNESATATKRVRFGVFDAIQVRQNDGYVTANTTVTWDGGRETFDVRRKVA